MTLSPGDSFSPLLPCSAYRTTEVAHRDFANSFSILRYNSTIQESLHRYGGAGRLPVCEQGKEWVGGGLWVREPPSLAFLVSSLQESTMSVQGHLGNSPYSPNCLLT